MVSSIDGLVSGLSTSSLIDQLMQIESQGKTRLQNKVTAQQKVTTAFQSINTKVANLKNAATDLTTSATWAANKATSSATEVVTATASSKAVLGGYQVNVANLAEAHTRSATVSSTANITDGTGVKITVGSTTFDIAPKTETAQGVADAINASGAGVRATLVKADGGTLMTLTASKTGAASQFDVSGLTVQPATTVQGIDASLTIGGAQVTSASNTITNAVPGVTFTALAPGTSAVSIAADPGGIADKISSMVGLANSLFADVKSKAAMPDPAVSTSTAGPLAGNFLVQTLASDVLGTVSRGVKDLGSLASFGIQTTKDGTISFDRAKFIAAYQDSPDQAKAAISGGIATAMKDVATRATTNITAVIQNGTQTVNSLNTQIANWTTRLTVRRESLQKQFTNLEVALGKLQNQSNWLAGQITSLSSSS